MSSTVAELARRVIAGVFGNSDARMAVLSVRYDELLAEVNRILGRGTVAAGIDALARRTIVG